MTRTTKPFELAEAPAEEGPTLHVSVSRARLIATIHEAERLRMEGAEAADVALALAEQNMRLRGALSLLALAVERAIIEGRVWAPHARCAQCTPEVGTSQSDFTCERHAALDALAE